MGAPSPAPPYADVLELSSTFVLLGRLFSLCAPLTHFFLAFILSLPLWFLSAHSDSLFLPFLALFSNFYQTLPLSHSHSSRLPCPSTLT